MVTRQQWLKKKQIEKDNFCSYQAEVWYWIWKNLKERGAEQRYNMWKYRIGITYDDSMFVHNSYDYLQEHIDTKKNTFKPQKELLDRLAVKNKPRKKQTRGRTHLALDQPQCKCKHFNYEHFKGKCKECKCEGFEINDTKR